jgi:D-arabinose 1-dehydrogenase-like Zn-dependent alcohol dehydrogenase
VYAKLAGYTVISTSSPRNFDLLKACGADYIFDHSDPATINAIRDLFPIDYWLDTISLQPSITSIFKILAPEGKSLVTANILVLLPPSMIGVSNIPEGVTLQAHRFATAAPENAEWHKYFLARGGYMEQAIKNDLLKTVPADVLGGLEKVSDAFDLLLKGVSARKIVIEPWA